MRDQGVGEPEVAGRAFRLSYRFGIYERTGRSMGQEKPLTAAGL